jgi:DNA-binding NarL/FixJ family response regulator
MAIQILIVDDVRQVRDDLCTLLTLAGDFEVVGEAPNGLKGYHLVERLRPNVVLMDLEMPVMDGFEATRRIKSLCPHCRVIALTIHGGEEERRKAFTVGVDAFLVKGATFEELTVAIRGNISDYRDSKEV